MSGETDPEVQAAANALPGTAASATGTSDVASDTAGAMTGTPGAVGGTHEAAPHAGIWGVAFAIAWRGIHIYVRRLDLMIPSLVFPLIFLASFAGGLSALGGVHGFDFPAGYTAFQFVFVLMQASMFSGLFTGFTLAFDFEDGFARRLMLAASDRRGIALGYALVALTRALIALAVLTCVALIAGMKITGDGVDLVELYGLALLLVLVGYGWAAGVAFRFRTIQAGPLMQTPVFLILFLAPVYFPLPLLKGWIHAVASINPATALLDAGRGLISGAHDHTLLAFFCALALIALFAIWTLGGLRAAERSPWPRAAAEARLHLGSLRRRSSSTSGSCARGAAPPQFSTAEAQLHLGSLRRRSNSPSGPCGGVRRERIGAEALARLPQLARGGGVVGVLGGADRLAPVEVEAAGVLVGGVAGEQREIPPRARGPAHLWQEEQRGHQEAPGQALRGAVVACEPRAGHQSGIEGVDGDAATAPAEAAVEFVGEEDVAELGGGVAPAGEFARGGVRLGFGAGEIGGVGIARGGHSGAAGGVVRVAADDQDPRGSLQQRQHSRHEREVPEVVDGEGQLEAVGAEGAGAGELQARVADQRSSRGQVRVREAPGEAAHGCQRGEIEFDDGAALALVLPKLRHRVATPLEIAHREDRVPIGLAPEPARGRRPAPGRSWPR